MVQRFGGINYYPYLCAKIKKTSKIMTPEEKAKLRRLFTNLRSFNRNQIGLYNKLKEQINEVNATIRLINDCEWEKQNYIQQIDELLKD